MTERPRVVPTVAKLTRANGDEVELVISESPGEPDTFYLMTPDGCPLAIFDGDKLYVDVLGPGQSVKVMTSVPPGGTWSANGEWVSISEEDQP